MSRSYGRQSRGGSGKVEVDPATKLHEVAAKLFDKGDGHGADWATASDYATERPLILTGVLFDW